MSNDGTGALFGLFDASTRNDKALCNLPWAARNATRRSAIQALTSVEYQTCAHCINCSLAIAKCATACCRAGEP